MNTLEDDKKEEELVKKTYTEKKCSHGKRKRYCKDCNGSSFCIHQRIKYGCIECKSVSICEHNRVRSKCKDCGGSRYCIHKKIKSMCIECGGSELCECGKRRSRCIKCGGSELCCHLRRKSTCKDCKGGSVCQHNYIRTTCIDCNGSQICFHGKIKTRCKNCNGSGFCLHQKRKSTCVDCNGISICIHKKLKDICKICFGNKICIHIKRKTLCKICGGSSLCKSEWCETSGNKKYEGYCLSCFVNNPENQDKPIIKNYKTKEKEVVEFVKQQFPNYTWMHDKKVQDGCSKRRPDLLLDMGSHIVIIEVDENKHTDYDCSCENKRLMQLSQDVLHRPIIFIRFNPDGYKDINNVSHTTCWKVNKLGILCIPKTKQEEWNQRLNTLKEQIQYWIDNPSEKTIEIVELFY